MSSTEVLQRFETLDREAEILVNKISEKEELLMKLTRLLQQVPESTSIYGLWSYDECRIKAFDQIIAGVISTIEPLKARIQQINIMRVQVLLGEIKKEIEHILH